MNTSRVVHKYAVPIKLQAIEIELPAKTSKVVHLDLQEGLPHIWVEHDKHPVHRVKRHFAWSGTGHLLRPGWEHVGTVLIDSLVWHLYLEPEAR